MFCFTLPKIVQLTTFCRSGGGYNRYLLAFSKQIGHFSTISTLEDCFDRTIQSITLSFHNIVTDNLEDTHKSNSATQNFLFFEAGPIAVLKSIFRKKMYSDPVLNRHQTQKLQQHKYNSVSLSVADAYLQPW